MGRYTDTAMHTIWPPPEDAEITCVGTRDVYYKSVTYRYVCSDCGETHNHTTQEPETFSEDDKSLSRIYPDIKKTMEARRTFETA
jgi:DNA-directed RNA polymerase subunit RPC12/RpoP